MIKKVYVMELFCVGLLSILISCNTRNNTAAGEALSSIDLKRGDIISCGPANEEFGAVNFEISCKQAVTEDFDVAIALLHSFEYDEAEKVFARIIDKSPNCAMAYWGVAMANYHPLWDPPTPAELEKGAKAVAFARNITQKTKMEEAYVNAIALFYENWDVLDHRTRSQRYMKAMEEMYREKPGNTEIANFYTLALLATADPADKTFSNQKKAGDILSALYKEKQGHPGIVHYLIHAYDFPGLAEFALPAARKYASIAPSSAHAQHMPAHIFIRLGLWDECIRSSLASTSAAKCYAENAGIKGHWDEELHGMDYLIYAYLQKGENSLAKEQWEYLKTMHEVYPVNFKDAYAFAAIPARYLLENKMWKEAAGLQIHPANFPWEKFPWQKAIFHFTRLLGFVNTDQPGSADTELKILENIHDTLLGWGDQYKANKVLIQIKAGKACQLFKEKNGSEAIKLMTEAADLEDKTEKHPVTPGEIVPARELLAEMFLQMNDPKRALMEFETSMKQQPNRLNALYGAGSAAERLGDVAKAKFYYEQLTSIANTAHSNKKQLVAAKMFLDSHP